MRTIEEKNRMIAEFMGYEIMYRPFGGEFIEVSDTELCDLDDLQYYTSWGWLMPVVEKIESFTTDDGYHYNFKIENTFVLISRDGEELVEVYGDVLNGERKISVVYKAIVKFIEWYNENK